MKVEKQLSSLATRVLLRPRITEKAYAVNALDQYVFQVASAATKTEVKRAVEEAYGVTVIAVNMVRLPGKRKNLGRTVGQRSSVKKALVRLKKGESIQLFQAGI
ncbi:MAG: 50S ribosomal protein L23 [Candidatus Moraniibacteriota bacterium]|nr:MAG: 50S ribosomal protein L23 [Candidatus Moranbacteria bacterium]